MFYSLVNLEDSFHGDYVYKVLAMSPCFWLDYGAMSTYISPYMEYADYGIYAFNGPNWTTDLETICANFEEKHCTINTDRTGNPAASIKSFKHWL